jgi:hypothetical protein
MAEHGGALEGDIRRLGIWNSQALALADCYLTPLPWPVLRTMAGFPPERGYFHLKRAAIVFSRSVTGLTPYKD